MEAKLLINDFQKYEELGKAGSVSPCLGETVLCGSTLLHYLVQSNKYLLNEGWHFCVIFFSIMSKKNHILMIICYGSVRMVHAPLSKSLLNTITRTTSSGAKRAFPPTVFTFMSNGFIVCTCENLITKNLTVGNAA